MDVIKWKLNWVECNFNLKSYLWFQIEFELRAWSILKSHVWFEVKLHFTQFNYHYQQVLKFNRLASRCERTENITHFRVNKMSGQNFQSVKNSSSAVWTKPPSMNAVSEIPEATWTQGEIQSRGIAVKRGLSGFMGEPLQTNESFGFKAFLHSD